MESKTQLRFIRISPKKAALVAKLVRGKTLTEARQILKVTPKKSAFYLLKLLKTAENNAAGRGLSSPRPLYLKELQVGEGPRWKRGQAVSRGVSHPRQKRTTHLTVVLAEEGK